MAIALLDATPFQVALLGTIEFLPFVLFSLPAGAWVDRLRRRPILILADVGRAASLASIPIAGSWASCPSSSCTWSASSSAS